MKRLFLLILPALVMVAAFSSCGKDDDKDNDGFGNNSFIINGKTVNLVQSNMWHCGDFISNGVTKIDFTLSSSDDYYNLRFCVHVPYGNTKLVAGTYSYEIYSMDLFAFSDGFVNFDKIHPVTDGTVDIAVSGSTYTITVDCEYKDGVTVKGTYIGPLKLDDQSK